MEIVSLFSGAGGLDLGLMQGGNEIIWANDIDADSVATYRENIGGYIVHADIKDVALDDIPDADVVVGGFPCQGFSQANLRRSEEDGRNKLYIFFRNVIRAKQPRFFIAENVKGILSLGGGNAIKTIVKDFEDAGYMTELHLVNMADSDIQTYADLAGKNVVAQSGSSALTALQNDPGDGSNDENLALAATFQSLEEIADYNSAFMNMDAGIYDAIAVDIGVARHQLSTNEGKYRILDEEISKEEYAIAFKLGNTELRDQVQETLNEMAADGTVNAIAEKYAEDQLPEMLIIGK